MSVKVKNKINQKWLSGVYSDSNNKTKPRYTDNEQAAFEFVGMHTALPIIESLNDYSLSEWAFYENGKLMEEKRNGKSSLAN